MDVDLVKMKGDVLAHSSISPKTFRSESIKTTDISIVNWCSLIYLRIFVNLFISLV